MKRRDENYEFTRRQFAQMAAGFAAATLAGEAQRGSGDGAAEFRSKGSTISLGNARVEMSWRVDNGRLAAAEFADSRAARKATLGPDVFRLQFEGGRTLRSSEMTLADIPVASRVTGVASASQRAARRAGRQVQTHFRDAETGAAVEWRAILLDGTRYARQEVTITAGDRDVPLHEVAMWDFDAPGAKAVGTVKGSPVSIGSFYLGFEHPLSTTTVADSHVRCSLPRVLPLRAGQSLTCSSVIGATDDSQLRRQFQDYVEDQRAHPFRTFLHYNSWYDLGYFNHYDEAGVLDRIHAFGTELKTKRGVTLDSFLFDDGWDDPASLWNFHSGFPHGFASAAKAAASFGAGIGVWMSPWGGYGKPKEDRVKYGQEQGFEIVRNGFALSGPKYYARFLEACEHMISEFHVNQFKIDGTGNANSVFPGSKFDSDFDAAISLIGELRKKSPDLYVNLTTGTYPSPFWLRYADSIWRGGSDHDFAGVGTWRQKWITYRDANTFRRVVTAGPLYPINSLMLHGLIYGQKAKNLDTDPGGDFRSEVRDYFGTGTQLQEMYITPGLLSQQNWDDLAEAARWSRSHAQTLIDNHWIGGDPAQLEPYGWAAWSQTGGILTLRNPNEKEQAIHVDVTKAFELPAGARQRYRAASPWKSDVGKGPRTLEAGKPAEFKLAPFEVLNLVCTA
ncbi:MAG TPA: enterotoxin [Bryobacteraceae bacterium]|nr:enterotoxin [Bryobacteraceae bacterium]